MFTHVFIFFLTSHNSNGHNSLDENAVTDGGRINGPLTPTDSMNGSHQGSGSESSGNDKSALCRGVSAGRITPQNMTIPTPNGRINNNNKKDITSRLAKACTNHVVSQIPSVGVQRKNSINTVYISSNYPENVQYNPNIMGNNLSIINLETTEL